MEAENTKYLAPISSYWALLGRAHLVFLGMPAKPLVMLPRLVIIVRHNAPARASKLGSMAERVSSLPAK